MSGGVPANTTTTTTVNQSPWQNPTYQALMLGTKDNPGPITNILRSNAGYMNAYNRMLGQGTTPMDVVRSNQFNPTAAGAGTSFQAAAPAQAAANGGIMNARGFASGGDSAPKPLGAGQQKTLAQLQKLVDAKKPLTPAQQKKYDFLNSTNQTYQTYQADQKKKEANTAAAQQGILEQSMGQTAFTRVNPQTGALESTNPLFNQAVNRVQDAQQMPEQFGQATAAYNQAISGLGGLANYTPQQIEASKIARGDVRDVAAQQADVERMQGGPNVQAIQAQANQMVQPSDVAGQTYQAANIAPTRRERAATTAAPKTWTDPGVAQQYMNPYAQAVINQNVQEANRNFQKNLSALRGQAAKSKAYGGSRQGLEEAEALRNQGYLLADIQDKGLSQAYTQGMGQFQAEQGLGSQVGMSNTAQINQLKQQYMSMGLSEAQANQAAQNAASQFGAQSAQQAALANQQAGLTTGQANLSAAQQTALANQQAGMTAQQLNQLYGQGGFQTQAANQAAQNQAYNNYVAQMLAAQQGNQQVDYNTLLQNAQLAQQAATANQQAGLQANQQNIGAYGQMLSGAQGLGALGGQQASTNLANIGALGQAASAWQNLGQQYLNTQATNAQNAMNLPSNLYSGALNAINAQPSTGGTTTATGTSSPASWMGRAEGGEVEAHKEWDKAKGGKTAKTGIASRGWN